MINSKHYPLIVAVFVFLLVAPRIAGAQVSLHDRVDSLTAAAQRWLAKPDSLTYYAEKAYELAKKTTYLKGKAHAAKFKGVSAFYDSNFDEAIVFYRESLADFSTLGDSLEVAKAYYNIATATNAKADYGETLANGLKALAIFESIGNQNGEGRVYNLLGIAANAHQDYKKSLSYFRHYYELVRGVSDSLEMATGLNNMGSTFMSLQETDSAIHYLTLSKQLYETIGVDRNMGSIYSNLGTLYEEKGELQKAIELSIIGLDYARTAGNRQREAGLLANLGRYYYRQRQQEAAVTYLRDAIKIAEEVSYFEVLYRSNEELAKISASQGRYADAYRHMLAVEGAKDSVYAIEKMKSTEELQARFETAKKEQQIEILNQETAIQKLKLGQRNLLLVIALATLVSGSIIIFFVFKQRRLTAEARLQRELSVQQEKATREVLNAEERERRRIASDLHDGVGQLLSSALLNLKFVDKAQKAGEPIDPAAVDRAIQSVKESYEEMRDISHQMMPNALLKSGFVAAVREFISKLDSKALKVNLHIAGLDERLSEQTETILYRIIQEGVTNVIKHASATQLTIQLARDDEGISLTIEDNGKGFDRTDPNLRMGVGLKNIRDRIDILKGFVEIDSAPGKGVLLSVFVPA